MEIGNNEIRLMVVDHRSNFPMVGDENAHGYGEAALRILKRIRRIQR